MKTTNTKWAIALLFLFFTVHSKAQFSFVGGPNFSNVRHNDLLPGIQPKTGMFTGLSIQYYPFPQSDRLSVINEFLYIAKGYRQHFGKEKYMHTFSSIAFPILLNYDISSRFSTHAGCELSFIPESEKYKGKYRNFDVGLNVGIGYYIIPKRVVLFSRFNYGLLPQLDYYKFDELGNMSPTKDVKNINAMVGLKFEIGNGKKFRFR